MNTPVSAANAIKAVIFDVDGVLLDSREANIVFYRNFLSGYGYLGLSEEVLAMGHHMNLRQAIAYMTQAPAERVEELWVDACKLPDYPEHLIRIPDGARETLEALSRRYPLAIVTSRVRAGIDHFYNFTGLRLLFTTDVAFEDYERPKPDAQPLLVACQRLGVEPRHVVYVGDAPSDYVSAQAAGTGFIAYGDGIPDAEIVITSFDQLDAALSRLTP